MNYRTVDGEHLPPSAKFLRGCHLDYYHPSSGTYPSFHLVLCPSCYGGGVPMPTLLTAHLHLLGGISRPVLFISYTWPSCCPHPLPYQGPFCIPSTIHGSPLPHCATPFLPLLLLSWPSFLPHTYPVPTGVPYLTPILPLPPCLMPPSMTMCRQWGITPSLP